MWAINRAWYQTFGGDTILPLLLNLAARSHFSFVVHICRWSCSLPKRMQLAQLYAVQIKVTSLYNMWAGYTATPCILCGEKGPLMLDIRALWYAWTQMMHSSSNWIMILLYWLCSWVVFLLMDSRSADTPASTCVGVEQSRSSVVFTSTDHGLQICKLMHDYFWLLQ